MMTPRRVLSVMQESTKSARSRQRNSDLVFEGFFQIVSLRRLKTEAPLRVALQARFDRMTTATSAS